MAIYWRWEFRSDGSSIDQRARWTESNIRHAVRTLQRQRCGIPSPSSSKEDSKMDPVENDDSEEDQEDVKVSIDTMKEHAKRETSASVLESNGNQEPALPIDESHDVHASEVANISDKHLESTLAKERERQESVRDFSVEQESAEHLESQRSTERTSDGLPESLQPDDATLEMQTTALEALKNEMSEKQLALEEREQKLADSEALVVAGHKKLRKAEKKMHKKMKKAEENMAKKLRKAEKKMLKKAREAETVIDQKRETLIKTMTAVSETLAEAFKDAPSLPKSRSTDRGEGEKGDAKVQRKSKKRSVDASEEETARASKRPRH